MDCAGIDGIIVVNLVGKNIACCEVDKRGDARDALMGECVGLVEIETEWNLKLYEPFEVVMVSDSRNRNRVEFKVFCILVAGLTLKVEIETEWNLKVKNIDLSGIPHDVEIETEWN